MGASGPASLNDPFLIDECLSLDLVALAHARGHHATHVVFREKQGASDPDLMPLIRDEGFVLVTNNARDFLTLYAEEEIRPGLVIIVPGGGSSGKFRSTFSTRYWTSSRRWRISLTGSSRFSSMKLSRCRDGPGRDRSRRIPAKHFDASGTSGRRLAQSGWAGLVRNGSRAWSLSTSPAQHRKAPSNSFV